MRAYVENPDYYRRTTTVSEMIATNSTNFALYVVLGTNRHVAVQNQHRMPLSGLTEIVIPEEHKTPLYKQAMELQMGKRPKTVDISRKIIQIRQISADDDRGYTYKLYMARI